MKKALFVWELGSGYGHVGTFLELARQLRQNGCQVCFALRDPGSDEDLLRKAGFQCYRAPRWKRSRGAAKRSHNYTEMLTRFGFLESSQLADLVREWRDLYAQIGPDILIANHSPTALLASTGLDMKRVLYGTGFECPPRLSPLPPIDPDCDIPEARLQDCEKQVLQTINDVCSQFGVAVKQSVADILAADAQFLCTFAELDPYRDYREAPEYWGPQIDSRPSMLSKWLSTGKGEAIFAYLRPEYSRWSETLEALQQTGRQVVVHCPGIPREYVNRYTTAALTFTMKPIDSRQMVSRFGLVVSHAGHGTSLALLLGGRPQLMLPMNLEQELNARAVCGLNAGLSVGKEDQRTTVAGQLAQISGADEIRQAARAFASRYEDFVASRQTRGISGRILRLLAESN